MDVMAFVQTFHGHWRWIVALVAVVAAVKFLLGMVNKSKVAQIDKTIASAFAGVMTVQFVLGVVTLLWKISLGAFVPAIHAEHLTYGIVAVALSHMIPMRKDDRPDAARFSRGFLFVLIAVVLTVLSVSRLRGGWVY
jgi:heme A synthase